MRKLTPKQENFAKGIALDGLNYVDAYRKSYSTKNMSDNAIRVEASNLANSPIISLIRKEIARETDTPKVMNVARRKEKLSEMAESDDPNVAMKAIDLLNKMDGEYVQKIAAEVQTETTINIELVDDDE